MLVSLNQRFRLNQSFPDSLSSLFTTTDKCATSGDTRADAMDKRFYCSSSSPVS